MKKVKNLAPKSLKWRKYLKISLWVLVIFWTLGSVRGFSLAAKINAMPQEEQKVKQEEKIENYATSIGAQTFSENFLVNYITWNKDNYQERVDRLKPYLREGVDEQAGLRFDSLTGSSSPEKTELWEVSETGKDTAIHTFKVTHTVTTVDAATKKPVKSAPSVRWIEVPVITDGKAFLINGIPTFTSGQPIAAIEPIKDKSVIAEVDPATKAEIDNFLKTFFKQYSTGTYDELQYLTTDKSVRPLGGTLAFKEVQNLLFTESKDNSYTIETDALFIDNVSKVQVLQPYSLKVSEENGRWQVIKFN